MKRMKKMLAMLLALVMLLSLSCTMALAAGEAEPEVAGIYAVTGSANVTLTPMTGGKTPATVAGAAASIGEKPVTFHAGAEQVEVTITGATAGKYYMFFALNEDTDKPPADAIEFVDQATADGTVSCKVYPMTLSAGQTYHIYVSSNDTNGGLKKVGSFTYYEPYTLGDVDDDGKINSTDALMILQNAVDRIPLTKTQEKAADVNRDGKVNSSDALLVLQFAVDRIPSFDLI